MKKAAKKTVYKISDGFEYDFTLIGIISIQANYRLCRELNISLGLNFERKEDYTIFSQKRMEEQHFPKFECWNELKEHFVLFSNKHKNALLIPEKTQYDYLLLAFPNEAFPIDENELLAKVKKTKFVLGAYLTVPSSLKSRDNLIF